MLALVNMSYEAAVLMWQVMFVIAFFGVLGTVINQNERYR